MLAMIIMLVMAIMLATDSEQFPLEAAQLDLTDTASSISSM